MSRLGMYFLPHTIHAQASATFPRVRTAESQPRLLLPNLVSHTHTYSHTNSCWPLACCTHSASHTHSGFPFQLPITCDSFPVLIRRQCMDDKQSWLRGWASQWRPPHTSKTCAVFPFPVADTVNKSSKQI
jgi:hypothetical protein